jgi:hypothetical protein
VTVITPTNFFLFNTNMNCQIINMFWGVRGVETTLSWLLTTKRSTAMQTQQGHCRGGKPNIKGTYLRAFLTHKVLERKNGGRNN